jgi:hypothetical protein
MLLYWLFQTEQSHLPDLSVKMHYRKHFQPHRPVEPGVEQALTMQQAVLSEAQT